MLGSLVAVVVGGLLGSLEWRRLAVRHPGLTIEGALPHARHLIAVVPVTLLLLAVQVVVVMRPDAVWQAPVWIELHYVELLFGALLLCISLLFGVTTYGAFATGHPQRWAAVVAAAILLGIVTVIQWDFSAPIASKLHAHTTADGIVLQSSPSSCAAASAANLARLLGQNRSEPEMAALIGTSSFGTSPSQVIAGLRKIGLDCVKTRRGDHDAAALRTPAILFLRFGASGIGHAIVLEKVAGDTLLVLDPTIGRRTFDRAEFKQVWGGHAVECGK